MTGGAGLRALSAREELSVRPLSLKLLPFLLRQGLSCEEAVALAYNTALLYLALSYPEPLSSPMELLSHLSFGQIAQLCEEYEDITHPDTEYGVNTGFEEAVN